MAIQNFQPWFDTLAQGTQVAQSLQQAAIQHQALQQAQQQFNATQALEQQKFGLQQTLDKANLIGQGATPVDAGGNVNVPAPQASFQPGPGGQPQTTLQNTGQTASVPADASKPTVSVGGSTLQVATPLDKLNASIAAQRATEQALYPTYGQLFGDDLPHGADTAVRVPEQGVAAVMSGRAMGQMMRNQQQQQPAASAPVDQQRLDTAAQSVALKYGVKVDPGKPALPQLTPAQRQEAFTLDAQLKADPDIKASTLATQESARATQAASRATMAQTQQLNQQKLQNQQEAGAQLSPAGKKALETTAPVIAQIDEIRNALEQKNPKDPNGRAYKDDNNPLTLAAPMALYRLGRKSPEGELGNKISDVSLAALQGVQQYLGKSRNYKYVQDVKQHAPSLSGLTPDSPAQIYAKFGGMERNMLRMKSGTLKYETAKTSTNPANPTLQTDDAQRYYKLAAGDPKAAREMAAQDGWTIPESQ